MRSVFTLITYIDWFCSRGQSSCRPLPPSDRAELQIIIIMTSSVARDDGEEGKRNDLHSVVLAFFFFFSNGKGNHFQKQYITTVTQRRRPPRRERMSSSSSSLEKLSGAAGAQTENISFREKMSAFRSEGNIEFKVKISGFIQFDRTQTRSGVLTASKHTFLSSYDEFDLRHAIQRNDGNLRNNSYCRC